MATKAGVRAIPLLDLTRQYQALREPIQAAIARVIVYNQFVIRAPRRDRLRAWLADSGVGTEIYYPLPLHLRPALASDSYQAGDFPVSAQLAKDVLALPIFAELTPAEIAAVAGLIPEVYEGSA
jgi:dTDP-4-amino-4,6-dideoxygalactose transaminase